MSQYFTLSLADFESVLYSVLAGCESVFYSMLAGCESVLFSMLAGCELVLDSVIHLHKSSHGAAVAVQCLDSI